MQPLRLLPLSLSICNVRAVCSIFSYLRLLSCSLAGYKKLWFLRRCTRKKYFGLCGGRYYCGPVVSVLGVLSKIRWPLPLCAVMGCRASCPVSASLLPRRFVSPRGPALVTFHILPPSRRGDPRQRAAGFYTICTMPVKDRPRARPPGRSCGEIKHCAGR